MVSSLDKLTRKLRNNLLDVERSANRDNNGGNMTTVDQKMMNVTKV